MNEVDKKFIEDQGISSEDSSIRELKTIDGYNSDEPYVPTQEQILTVDTVADMLALDTTEYDRVRTLGRDSKLDGAGGFFVFDSSKVAINDRGIIFDGWVRQHDGPKNVIWFGAKGDGTTDDTQAFKDAGKGSFVPDRIFIVDETINKNNYIGHGVVKRAGSIAAAINTDNYNEKRKIAEIDITFPGYTQALANCNLTKMWMQGMTMYENRLYIMHGARRTDDKVTPYVCVYDLETFDYIYSFSCDLTAAGEGIVVYRSGGALRFFVTKRGTSIVSFDITNDPADLQKIGAPLLEKGTRYEHWLAMDTTINKLIVQKKREDYTGQRNLFAIVDPITLEEEETFFVDGNYTGLLGEYYISAYKMQNMCIHEGKMVLIAGTAYAENEYLEHKNKIGGLIYLNDLGKYEHSVRYSPQGVLEELRRNDVDVDIIEFEGICSYENSLFTLQVSKNPHLVPKSGGLILWQEKAKGIDFSSAGRIFGSTKATLLSEDSLNMWNGDIPHPFYPEDRSKDIKTLEDMVEYMRHSDTHKLTFWLINTTVLDMNGEVLPTSALIEITSSNLYSFRISMMTSGRREIFWLVRSGTTYTQNYDAAIYGASGSDMLKRVNAKQAQLILNMDHSAKIGIYRTGTAKRSLIEFYSDDGYIGGVTATGNILEYYGNLEGTAQNSEKLSGMSRYTGTDHTSANFSSSVAWIDHSSLMRIGKYLDFHSGTGDDARSARFEMREKLGMDGKTAIWLMDGDLEVRSGRFAASVIYAANGASGSFTSSDGKTITVVKGIVTNIG